MSLQQRYPIHKKVIDDPELECSVTEFYRVEEAQITTIKVYDLRPGGVFSKLIIEGIDSGTNPGSSDSLTFQPGNFVDGLVKQLADVALTDDEHHAAFNNLVVLPRLERN